MVYTHKYMSSATWLFKKKEGIKLREVMKVGVDLGGVRGISRETR